MANETYTRQEKKPKQKQRPRWTTRCWQCHRIVTVEGDEHPDTSIARHIGKERCYTNDAI